MRNEWLARWCLLAALPLFVFTGAAAQEGGKEQTIVPMKGGFFVAFTTAPGARAAGADGWSTTSAEALFESNTIRRVFVDSGGPLYFGYALVVEPLAASRQFRVSVRPLSPEDERELRGRETFRALRIHPSYNPAGLSRSAAPQTIADGDAFALDVLVNPRTGEKVTDFVTVSWDESGLRESPPAGGVVEPRDFTLADVELKVGNYQLLVNGELVAAGKRSGALSGPVIWFHLEGRGRFIFSLMPHPGYDFRKIGTIERNRMKFTLGGEHYEWVSEAPVIGAGGNWNLYVLHDPGYIPDSFFLGVRGAARAETRHSSPSRLKEFESALRLPQRARPNAFGRPPGPRKADEPEKAPALRLIIGAANRVENLLPKT